jgi:hypothetical protein
MGIRCNALPGNVDTPSLGERSAPTTTRSPRCKMSSERWGWQADDRADGRLPGATMKFATGQAFCVMAG